MISHSTLSKLFLDCGPRATSDHVVFCLGLHVRRESLVPFRCIEIPKGRPAPTW